MSEAKVKLVLHRGWESQALSTLEAGALVAEVVSEIRNFAVRDAPRHKSPKTNWNTIKKNIHGYVERDARGYYGNVTIEQNERVRHALLQEYGWTDKRGRKHRGRKYLKGALLKARKE